MNKTSMLVCLSLALPMAAQAAPTRNPPPNGVTFLKADAAETQLIRIDANKTIKRYPSASRVTEINLMTVNGRSPIAVDQFIYNSLVHFMVYVTKGTGTFYVDDAVLDASEGDVLDVPPKTRFAVRGDGLEYVTVENPAFFPEQAYIVDAAGRVVSGNQLERIPPPY
jgi:mannose-6-phosphate isomerase-like protein (cupin superfamily)